MMDEPDFRSETLHFELPDPAEVNGILEDGGIEEVDADLYRRFSGDRRPLPMPAVER